MVYDCFEIDCICDTHCGGMEDVVVDAIQKRHIQEKCISSKTMVMVQLCGFILSDMTKDFQISLIYIAIQFGNLDLFFVMAIVIIP